MVDKVFDKKSSFTSTHTWTGINFENQQLAGELHKHTIKKNFLNVKYVLVLRPTCGGLDVVDIQLIGQYNELFCFLLCIIDIFGKYTWAVPLKHKKDFTIINAFETVLDKTNCKANKIWVDKVRKFTIDQWNHDYKTIM